MTTWPPRASRWRWLTLMPFTPLRPSEVSRSSIPSATRSGGFGASCSASRAARSSTSCHIAPAEDSQAHATNRRGKRGTVSPACGRSGRGPRVVCLPRDAADDEQPHSLRPRQRLPLRARSHADDVLRVQRIPVPVHLDLARPTQRDVDLLLAELLGRGADPLGRVIVLGIVRGVGRHVDDREPERAHPQLGPRAAELESLDEPLDHVELVDPLVRHLGHRRTMLRGGSRERSRSRTVAPARRPPALWLDAAGRLHRSFGTGETTASARLLALALREAGPSSDQLLRETFAPVHRAVVEKSLSSEAKVSLDEHLPGSQKDSRARRLWKALVERLKSGAWSES